MDEDFLGKYDLIEQFECKFFPTIADNANKGGRQPDPSTYKEWTPLTECHAKHQPTKLRYGLNATCKLYFLFYIVSSLCFSFLPFFRLFFRWRVFPIDMAECGTELKPSTNIVLQTQQTTHVERNF